MDYRLDRLSPRFFEHIIQALALGAIASTVTPFGDGPDGGREATFEGATDYGSVNSPWNGYGIIQAKYKARPEDPLRESQWVKRELQKELKQYTRTDNPRPIPEYFILATNVVLSPGDGGGKEKVLGVLRPFAEKYHLKGFDLWDYDKLRVLLDRDSKVRNAYMAWLLPSDVISQLCELLGDKKRDTYKLIVRYLQRELIADQYAQLEQAGHSADESIPLAQVFIDLPSSPRIIHNDSRFFEEGFREHRFVAKIVSESSESLILPDSSEEDGPPSSKTTGRYVLIGGPGQGKTTIAQYICQIFRTALLKDVPARRLDKRVPEIVSTIMSQWEEGGNPLPSGRRLPFRIVLSQFAKSLASGETESIMGYLALKICSGSETRLRQEEVERILSEYPSIIILDGLDEVPASTNRDEVIEAVSNFSIDVASGDLDVFLVATTRPQGYNEEFSPRQYEHHFLTPLTSDDALTYGERLAQSRFGSNTERFYKVRMRLQRAVTNIATAKLMRTPLQVTILTLLVDRIGDPPEDRWNLFRDYYQLIYERETERDIASVQILREHRIDVDTIHRRVGIALQVESEKSGRTDARLTVAQFSRLVRDYLAEEGYSGSSLERLATQIIEAAANRLVFLVGLEMNQVGFEIRSLQEFMAAESIIDGRDETIQDRLRVIAPLDHWRNVFLFAAGRCFSDRRHLRDTVLAICVELNDSLQDPSPRLLLSGSELALDLLEDGPARKAPAMRATLIRLAIQLLEIDTRDQLLEFRTSNARRVSALCDESTIHIFAEYLRDRMIGKQCFNISMWSCLTILIERFAGDFEQIGRDLLKIHSMSDSEFDAVTREIRGNNVWLNQVLTQELRLKGITFHMPLLRLPEGDATQGGPRNPWTGPSFPSWVSWYAEYSNDLFNRREQYVLLQSLSPENIRFRLRFPRLESASDAIPPPPTDLPRSPQWDFIPAVLRFCSSPGKDAMADTLRSMRAAMSDRKVFSLAGQHYPWPLAEAILAQISDPDTDIASSIDAGLYGDAEDWHTTEQLMTRGIPIGALTEQAKLVDTRSGGLYRFPFRILSGAEFARFAAERHFISAVTELHDSCDSGLVRRFLATILVRGLLPLPPANSNKSHQFDGILFTYFSGASVIPSIFFQYLGYLNLEDPKWSSLFDRRSMTGASSSRQTRVTRDSINLLIAAMGGTAGHNRGLLVPLAAALIGADSSTRRSVELPPRPNSEVSLDASPIVKASSLAVEIIQGRDILSLSGDIAAIVREDKRMLRIFFEAIAARELPYAKECDDILAIASKCDLARSQYWFYLRRNFSRRSSVLLDSTSWRNLQLPSTIPDVLTQLVPWDYSALTD